MTRCLLILVIVAWAGFHASAVEIILPDGNRDTVQIAHDDAGTVNGDTLVLPVGEFWWTNKFTWTKAITIRGQGTNINDPVTSTVLRENLPTGLTTANQMLMDIDSALNSGYYYRLTNMGIRSGTNRVNEYFAGTIQLNGQSKAIIVDNLYMYIDYNRFFQVNDGAYGVVFNITADAGASIQFAFIEHGSVDSDATIFGDRSWALPSNFGSTNAMYFENIRNISRGADSADICDSQRGGRWVIRYSSTGHVVTHGAEVNSGRVRGTRAFEFYNNTVDIGAMAQNNLMEIRSGCGVIWGNTLVGATFPIKLAAYRAANQPYFWGGINGQTGWDVNRPGGPFISSTVTGAGAPSTSVLTDTTQSWTNNALVGYSITNHTIGGYNMIVANTATTATYTTGNTPMSTTNGHVYSIWGATNALDLTGLGQSDYLDYVADPTPRWLNFAGEGVYQWDNTWDGGPVLFETSDYPILKDGYHFFNNTPMPGYTPLVYPHPLATLVTPVVVQPTGVARVNQRRRLFF